MQKDRVFQHAIKTMYVTWFASKYKRFYDDHFKFTIKDILSFKSSIMGYIF